MASARVVVLGTGGTIAGQSKRPNDLVGYSAGQVGVSELLRGAGEHPGLLLETEQVAQIDSKDMDLTVWQRLLERLVHHLERPDVTGVVVTHGTDTLEETAFLLQYLLAPSKPVVLTCAMRPASALAPDGPQNLSDALCAASHKGAQGVLVVCAGRVHGPAEVTKVHTCRLDAFDSGDSGPLAVIEHGRLQVWRPWPGQETASCRPPEARRDRLAAFLACSVLPRVEVVLSHAAADGRLVRALLGHVPAGAEAVRGLVVAGTGNGSVHRCLEQALQEAMEAGVRVVRATRCVSGRVTPAPGDPLERSAGLSPVKARLALMLELIGR